MGPLWIERCRACASAATRPPKSVSKYASGHALLLRPSHLHLRSLHSLAMDHHTFAYAPSRAAAYRTYRRSASMPMQSKPQAPPSYGWKRMMSATTPAACIARTYPSTARQNGGWKRVRSNEPARAGQHIVHGGGAPAARAKAKKSVGGSVWVHG